VLIEVVQHDLGHGVALEDDDQALAGPAAALVAHVRDAGDAVVLGQLSDLVGQVVRVDLIGQLAHDQAGPALAVLFDVDDGPHCDRPAPGPVGIQDAASANDLAVGREVRSLDPLDQRLEQVLVTGVEVVQVPLHALGDLAQVVRRDLGGHPDRDPLRAVDEQVGEPRGQHDRLGRPAVVVRPEIDRVLVDVPQHLHRQRGETALGVPHRGRRVVARRAEVALPVDERHPHRPRLGEPDQSVVDGRVPVRVVLAHDVTDNARALEEAAVGPVAAVVHRVQDADVHGLEPVADVGQGAADDDRHRVVDVAALHLDLDVDRLQPAARFLRRRLRRVHAHVDLLRDDRGLRPVRSTENRPRS